MDRLQGSKQLALFLTIFSGLLIPTNVISFAQTVDQDSDSNLKSYSTSVQMVTVSVRTDKSSYNQGDTVNISGKVSQTIPNTDLSIRIINPTKHLISVSSLMPLEDGSFSMMIIAAGTMWSDAGNYNVEIEYGDHVHNFITFYFSGGNEQFIVNPIITEIYHLKSGDQIYDIPYIIQGGIVKNMELLADNFTLITNIVAPTDGSLIVTLQRSLIDSQTSNGNDNQFRIAINQNQSSQFTETRSDTLRTLSIPFHAGNTKISIIGTVIGVNVVISKGASSGQDCISSNNCLSPSITTIDEGSTVVWTNNDIVPHTVTSGRLSVTQTGKFFDSGLIEAGGTYHFKFNNVGTFDYYCQIHPWVTGQIAVGNEISRTATNLGHDVYQPITISVTTDKSSYRIEDLVTISTIISGMETDQNVAVSIIDPAGTNIITLIITTDSQGSGIFQFKISQNSKFGTYQVIATSLTEDNNLKTLTQFTVSPSNSIFNN